MPLILPHRAKTIKNVVIVNEELTAEEWKRRWEKEKARNTHLKALLDKYEVELQRWRGGKGFIFHIALYYFPRLTLLALMLHPHNALK